MSTSAEPVFAVDFETYYDDTVSITAQGTHNYLRHPECAIYLVAIAGSDGTRFVGPPEEAPWETMGGATWVAHNAAFDWQVFDRLCETRGSCPAEPARWECTANLAAFLGAGRSLAEAARDLLGEFPDKSSRERMKGRRWEELPEDEAELAAWTLADVPGRWMGAAPWVKFTAKRRAGIPTREEMRRYALADAELCLRLWTGFAHEMPEVERAASRHTLLMTRRGIPIDGEAARRAAEETEVALWELAQELPWFGEDGAALGSVERFERELARHGLPAPPTTNKNDEAFQEWLDTHADDAPFIRAFSTYRSMRKIHKVVGGMAARADGDVLRYELRFFGGHTGRWSGGGRLNLQNLPRPDTVEKLGLPVDPRSLLRAPEGRRLVVADYAQIEARVALWVAGDWAQLAPLAEGMDLYEAHARATMGYDRPESLAEADPDLRRLAKARVLGLGFGCGADRFRTVARVMTGLRLTAPECERAVADYRKGNRPIVETWRRLDRALRLAARRGDATLELELPSLRRLVYHGPRHSLSSGDHEAAFAIGGRPHRLYGGKLFENLVQAIARDLLRDAVLRLEAAGFPVVLHVHDEVVCLVSEDGAQDAAAAITSLMTEDPGWAGGLPLHAEARVALRYAKDS